MRDHPDQPGITRERQVKQNQRVFVFNSYVNINNCSPNNFQVKTVRMCKLIQFNR